MLCCVCVHVCVVSVWGHVHVSTPVCTCHTCAHIIYRPVCTCAGVCVCVCAVCMSMPACVCCTCARVCQRACVDVCVCVCVNVVFYTVCACAAEELITPCVMCQRRNMVAVKRPGLEPFNLRLWTSNMRLYPQEWTVPVYTGFLGMQFRTTTASRVSEGAMQGVSPLSSGFASIVPCWVVPSHRPPRSVVTTPDAVCKQEKAYASTSPISWRLLLHFWMWMDSQGE
jgi:hypothetical protein